MSHQSMESLKESAAAAGYIVIAGQAVTIIHKGNHGVVLWESGEITRTGDSRVKLTLGEAARHLNIVN